MFGLLWRQALRGSALCARSFNKTRTRTQLGTKLRGFLRSPIR
jgi:hypothetical protein